MLLGFPDLVFLLVICGFWDVWLVFRFGLLGGNLCFYGVLGVNFGCFVFRTVFYFLWGWYNTGEWCFWFLEFGIW